MADAATVRRARSRLGSIVDSRKTTIRVARSFREGQKTGQARYRVSV